MRLWQLGSVRGLTACTSALAAGAVALTAAGCAREPVPVGDRVVTVFGTLNDADVDDVVGSLRDFERDTGIEVRYVSSSNFESDLLERLRRGEPPDLALLPQPGVLDTLVQDGFALPWDGDLDAASDGVDPFLVDLVTFDGAVYGSWYELTVKSLVWYSPRRFAERGLQVPTSWDELDRLTSELATSGTPPWCLGIRAAGATGWVATDWVEDLVLRFAGPDVYDRWVTHEVTFADAEIVEATERFGQVALVPDRVAGGNRAAVEVSVEDSANELLDPSVPCLLHRQASFMPRYLPAGVELAPDGDLWAFPLPAVDGGPAPLVVGGSVLVRFSDDRDVDRVAAYLLRDAEVVRFDASDLMPPEVGVGTFWSGMTSWLGGARLRSVVAEIDRSWPQLLTRPVLPEVDDE